MVRFTYKYLKPVALFLAIAVLFQCCKVYDKRPVILDYAINKTQLKITTTDGKKIVFSSIYYKNDSLLYGMTSKKTYDTLETKIPIEKIKVQKTVSYASATAEEIKTFDGGKYVFNSYYYKNDTLFGLTIVKQKKEIFLPIETIKEIRLYNPTKSSVGNVFLVLGGVGLIFAGLFVWTFADYGKMKL